MGCKSIACLNLGKNGSPKFKHTKIVTGKQLYRKDEGGEAFTNNLKRNDFFQVWVDSNLSKPYKWIVWAYNENGWAERVEQVL